MHNLLQEPSGLVLVSGHASSGRTTLLASAAEHLMINDPDSRLVTVSRTRILDDVEWMNVRTCQELPDADIIVFDEITTPAHARAVVDAAENSLVIASIIALGPRGAISTLRGLVDEPDFRRMLGDVLVASFSQLLMPSGHGLIPVREVVVNDDHLEQMIMSGGPLESAPRSTSRQERR